MGLVNIRDNVVLIAAKEPATRDRLKAVLAGAKFKTVLCAASGQEAVVALKTKKPGAVVLAADLEDIPAVALVTAIRTGAKKLGIIVVGATDATALKAAGASRVMAADISAEKLVRAVDDLLLEKMGIASSSIVSVDEN